MKGNVIESIKLYPKKIKQTKEAKDKGSALLKSAQDVRAAEALATCLGLL